MSSETTTPAAQSVELKLDGALATPVVFRAAAPFHRAVWWNLRHGSSSMDTLVSPDALRLAHRTLGTIRGNLAWAFGYNLAAIPIAALGLLNPLIAGAAMSLSPVLVVSNSLRLRNFAGTGEVPIRHEIEETA